MMRQKNNKKKQEKVADLVRYAFSSVKIHELPNNSVGIFVADASDILGNAIAPEMFFVPIAVYRTQKLFRFYSKDCVLCGAVCLVEKDRSGGLHVLLYGNEMHPRSKLRFTKFLNPTSSFSFSEIHGNMAKKFYNLPIYICNQNLVLDEEEMDEKDSDGNEE